MELVPEPSDSKSIPLSPGKKWHHDSRGLSFDDFHRSHGIGKPPRVSFGRDQYKYAAKGVYSNAHRVAARYAIVQGTLLYDENGNSLIPRAMVEEVVDALELGERLPVMNAGQRIKEVLHEILDLSEPMPAYVPPPDINL